MVATITLTIMDLATTVIHPLDIHVTLPQVDLLVNPMARSKNVISRKRVLREREKRLMRNFLLDSIRRRRRYSHLNYLTIHR